jgi:hypothetical protein
VDIDRICIAELNSKNVDHLTGAIAKVIKQLCWGKIRGSSGG